MRILPLKKHVNRDKCSFTSKQRMFGVFAIDEILRYRWTPFVGLRTLCHPVQLFFATFENKQMIPHWRGLIGNDHFCMTQNMVWGWKNRNIEICQFLKKLFFCNTIYYETLWDIVVAAFLGGGVTSFEMSKCYIGSPPCQNIVKILYWVPALSKYCWNIILGPRLVKILLEYYIGSPPCQNIVKILYWVPALPKCC